MATSPYLLQLPDADAMPGRTLRDGVSAMAINAESEADARAFAQAQVDNDCDAMWASGAAALTAVAANSDMTGWKFRLRIVNPVDAESNPSETIFDETIQASGTVAVKATGTLTLTPGAIADDKVTIGTTVYQFTDTVGSGDGSSGTPYLVNLGMDDAGSLANLRKAINATGTAGTDYSTGLTAHATVTATASDATTLSIQAKTGGTAGNAIATTHTVVTTDDGLAWGHTTLTGGEDADKVSTFANAMVTALNASSLIAAAAFDAGTGVLTVADTSDSLGDHRVFADFIAPDADTDALMGVAGFVTDKVDGGSAGDALTITLVADTYTVPTVVALLGPAVS